MIHNIHNLLNNIFTENIKNIYENNKIIRSEINEKHLLFYKFKYSQGTETKQNIVSTLNFKYNKSFNESSYYRKEKNISLKTYENILTDIKKLYFSITNNSDNSKKIPLVAIDGTYGNTNIKRKKGTLQTSLFMCYYDITNNVPIDINFKMNNCNNEVKLAQKWLNEYETNNEFIIVADRAYFKNDFFKFLIEKNIKFVIRIRNNAKIINDLKCRYIEKNVSVTKNFFNRKKNIYEKILCNNKYSIITNLSEEYNLNDIFKIYENRWEIEVFFKYIKSNFKIRNLKEKYKEDNDKLLICQQIIIYIAQLFENNFLDKSKIKKNINKKNKEVTTCKIKINKSLLIKGIFENLLLEIIEGKLTETILENFIGSFCKIIKNENNRSFERISLIPFTKWYVKKYLNEYKYLKISEALGIGDINVLNKNLKSKATTKVIK